MLRILVFFTFLYSAGFLPNSWAKPQFESSMDRNRIHLDESATFQVRVTWPKNEAEYSFIFPSLNLTNLSVQRQGESYTTFLKENTEWMKKTFTAELIPIRTGKAVVHSFSLSYTNPETQLGDNFIITEYQLEVSKPPIETSLIIIGITGIAIVLIGGFVFLFVRSKSRRQIAEEDNKPEEPGHRIREQIRALGPESLDRDQQQTLTFLASSLRQYLFEIYQLPQNKLTDAEIFINLSGRQNVDKDEIKILKSIFDRLHEARYMGQNLSPSDYRQLRNDISNYFESKRIIEHV